jgi:hypothetical protein
LACILIYGAGSWAPVSAQIPGGAPPGPFVIDLRGSTSGLPTAAPFYPPVERAIAVASRAVGFEAGAHVYVARLGSSRIGVGASFARVRGTSPDSSVTVRLLAPQVSFNFGSDDGWSHLSAGVGTGRVEAEVTGPAAPAAVSGTVRSVNYGGGARWFLTRHAAVGFDVRFHRLAAGEPSGAAASTPRVTLATVSVGVSLK